MANPIIKILRGHTAPPTLEAGRIAIDQTNKNLYVGIDDGNGGTINEIVGGSGTFATKQFVTDAVSAGTGSLGTMSTQNADSVAITGGAIDGTAIGATTASSGAFTTLTANSAALGAVLVNPDADPAEIRFNNYNGKITGLRDPQDADEAVRKLYVDSKIAELGSVFRYVGDVSAATGNDLTTLSDQNTGAYYRVDVAGTYTAGADSFAAKVGDAFVKTSSGWQKLDNVDAEVLGTANEIAVTGDEEVGYTVALAEEFKTRVSDVESKTQNIDLAETTAGSTKINGALNVCSNMLNVSPNSVILNMDVGADTVKSWATFEIDALGAQNDNGSIALKANGHLVATTNTWDSTIPEIRGFIIDGGEY